MNKNDLVKLSVSHKGYSISIKIPKDIFYANTEKILEALKNCLSMITDNKEDSAHLPEKMQFSFTTTPAVVKEDFKIRERIPNNVVDVKDLDIKQAATEEALVRCPNCGQSHCLAVNSGSKVYVMEKDFNKNDFNVIAEFDSLTSSSFISMCCKEDTDKLAYFNDLQNVKIISYDDFTVNNDTEIFCPVCCKSDTFFNWKNAYENPLEYFETEHLCDVCGGETVTKMVKKQKVTKCESCGHETKYKES